MGEQAKKKDVSMRTLEHRLWRRGLYPDYAPSLADMAAAAQGLDV
jgi:hypothetical protein